MGNKEKMDVQIQDLFSSDNLTDDQEELIKRLDEFLKDDSKNVFVLKGKAGTGKTFITRGLTEYFRKIQRNYILAASTGKAATVIARKTGSPAYTIHKIIYSYTELKEYSDIVDGTETFKFYYDIVQDFKKEDLIFIIDEASMISDRYSELEFFRWGTGYTLKDIFTFMNFDANVSSRKNYLHRR